MSTGFRRWAVAAFVAFVSAALAPAAANASSQTIATHADAFVSQGAPSANYGTTSSSSGYNWLYARETKKSTLRPYVKFNSPGAVELTAATVRFYCAGGCSGPVDLYKSASESWTEGSITWNNRPALGAKLVSRSIVAGWNDFKISPAALNASGTTSFVMIRPSTSRADFRSREIGTPAQLVVTTTSTEATIPDSGSTTCVRITSWRPVGSAPLSDTEAAARVCAGSENRSENTSQNAYKPSAAELETFRNGQRDKYNRTALMYNRLTAYVTGGYTGTTDQILQWVAHKWGIPEDVVRAVAANESWWRMSQLGDRKTVIDPLSYPLYSRIAGTSDVYQSLGIMQIKWTPQGLHPGTEPLRWQSTPFNADYWGAVVRYYYDGLCDWCSTGYSSGQDWASIGAWYNPSPWNTGSATYQTHVKERLAQRPWTMSSF